MQEKIKKKIIHNIVFATLFFVFIISMLTGFFITRNYINSFQDNAIQSVKLSTSYSQIKLENIKKDTFRLTESQTIIDGLDSNHYAISINPKLNFLRSQYQEEIASLILYANNDYIYKTDSISVSSILTLNTIRENYNLDSFINSKNLSFFFIQHQDQVINYFSFIHKIIYEDQFMGYLLINLRPTYLLTNYFTYQNSSTIDLMNQYIVVDNQKLYFSNVEEIDTFDQAGFVNLKTYVIEDNLFDESFPLITKVSTNSLIAHILELIFVIIIIDLIAIILAYISARHLAIKISMRFNILKQKMLSAPNAIK
ncbi:MAG: hypothetical protein K9L64_05590 [Candidatus Izimaplasma sp.]|nr:hypothetical protein [Candidatus Izimaplasma bacterium]